jgi:hypothetical protein
MKAKFGSIVVAGSGKIGGHVASRNRGGAYFRTKVTPVNPSTSAQAAVRARLTTNAQAWRGLTAAQRDQWNAAVADFSRTDIFGDLRNPSGFNLYVRINNNLASLGVAAVSVPPMPQSVDSYSDPVLTYTVGAAALSLAFTAVAGDDSGYQIWATPPLSAGKNFVKSEFRLIDTGTAAGASPIDILAAYQAVFGNVGSVGDKIFVKIVPVGGTTGITGIAVSTSTISAA